MQQPSLKKNKLDTVILSYCKIKNNSIWVNDKLVFQNNPTEDLSNFLGAAYKEINLAYPKFFKMDKQCKLGIIATELLIRNTDNFNTFSKQEMSIVLSNSASSLDSDRTHAQTISDKKNYFPSPAVFVYTLPNIVIGEIAIKHKITGENAFFVTDKFDSDLLQSYTEILLKKNETSVIAGWVNVDNDASEAFVYCVKKVNFKEENLVFQKQHYSKNIQQIYSR